MKIRFNIYFGSLSALSLTLLFLLSSCDEFDVREGIREVAFKVTADTKLITAGESITYIDSSLNVSARTWTFEGGDIPTSNQAEQMVSYTNPGEFSTTLEVTFEDGEKEDRRFLVNIEPTVEANFDANLRTVVVGSNVEFTNLSTGLDNQANVFAINDATVQRDTPVYYWEFEGGVPATSTQQDPIVTYNSTGNFKVKLTTTRYAPENANVIEREGFINVVDVNVISPATITLSKFGSQFNLIYQEGFSDISKDELTNFSLSVDGVDNPFTSFEVDPNDDKILILLPTNPIVEENQSIVLNYAGGSLFATSGSLVAPIIDFNVANTVINLWTGNVGFEEGEAGQFPPNWGTWNPTQSVNNNEFYETTDVDVKAGNLALQISYDGSGDQWIFDNKVPADVIPGGNYRVVFWAKSTMDGSVLDFRTIENGWAAANDPDDFLLTTEWTQYSFDFVADDAGSINRKIWWALPSSDQSFQAFVDDIKLFYLD